MGRLQSATEKLLGDKKESGEVSGRGEKEREKGSWEWGREEGKRYHDVETRRVPVLLRDQKIKKNLPF